MSHALAIASPTRQRRGACPSLDAPMQTGDGLLARLRVAGGQREPHQLIAIARLARQHGNGMLEITARGNLQVRGLTPNSSPAFAAAVHEIMTIETGLVVETPPLAGDDPAERADPRPLAAAIRAASTAFAQRLGPKVTVIVDGAGTITLAHLKVDLRLTALAGDRWLFSIGNDAPQAYPTDAALTLAVATLQKLAALGPAARAVDLSAKTSAAPPSPETPSPETPPIGQLTRRNGTAFGIALPFGSVHADALIDLANHATKLNIGAFCLAPHHALLAIDAPPAFATHAASLGFITDPADPRLRISACIGSDGCASGFIPARTDAAKLACALPLGKTLHVSGCAKGCAHPRRADVTLVGQTGGYGLVISGTAGDTPDAVLGADQLESALAGAQG